MVNSPTEEVLKHHTYICLACDAGPICRTCTPCEYVSIIYRGPRSICDCKKACLCRKSIRKPFNCFACSPKCHEFLQKYVKHPWRYEKQNFKLQVRRMVRNWDDPVLRISPLEHAYDVNIASDTEDEDWEYLSTRRDSVVYEEIVQ